MFKKIAGMLLGGFLSVSMCFTSFAAWVSDGNGWWFDNGNGTWPASCWLWVDGNQDGQAECYYFQQNGYIMLNSTTPDGYIVDANGAWVVDGVVQKRFTTVSNNNYTTTGSKSSNTTKKKEGKSSQSTKNESESNKTTKTENTASNESTKATKKELDSVILYDLDPVQSINTSKESSRKTVQGKLLSNVLRSPTSGYVGYAEYYTGGKYTTLTMTVAPESGFYEDKSCMVQIIGDDNVVLNESEEINYKTNPFEFTTNIAGQDFVRIKITGDTYRSGYILMDNAEFKK
jgi:cysteine-rich secretory protein family./putative cell wall binding repeat